MFRVSWEEWNGKGGSKSTGMVLAFLPTSNTSDRGSVTAVIMRDTDKTVITIIATQLTVIGQRQRIVIEGDA